MEKHEKSKKGLLTKVILCCLIVLIISPYLLMLVTPMRRPESMSTNYVLRLTPIGMDMEEVIKIVENHRNWSIAWISYERGFPHPRIVSAGTYIVGDKSMRVNMRSFWPANMPLVGLFMEMIVSIFFGFDEDGKLTDVYVWKSSQ